MSNVAGKAYALNVVTPTTRWHGFCKKFIFIAVRALPNLMAGLRGLSVIHFARWVIIKPKQWPTPQGVAHPDLYYDYTLFCSNFNGTWDQYIDAFSDGIPYMLDLAWYKDFRYPSSIPLAPFQRYIRHNQLETSYYYSATPGAAQRDIKASLRVWRGVRALASLRDDLDPISFRREYDRMLAFVQNDLGAMGFGAVASVPTEEAHKHIQPVVGDRWAPDIGDDEPAKENSVGEL